MAEWRVKQLETPPGIEELAETVNDVAGAVTGFLDAVVTALEVAKQFVILSTDLYSTIVNEIVDELQNFLNDIGETGISVLVDYPLDLNIGLGKTDVRADLGGTNVPVSDLNQRTRDDTASRGGYNRLQAIATTVRDWNPTSTAPLDYAGAITRIINAFDDIEDPLRPRFSDSANTVGVVIMGFSDSIADFLAIVALLAAIFDIEDLHQTSFPAFPDLFPEFSGREFSSLSQDELDLLDLSALTEQRNGGEHPNFVLNTRLGDLIPALGDLLEVLSGLLELLRPNGSLADFIEKAIESLQRKVLLIKELVDRLNELIQEILDAFGGSGFAMVVVESNTGNTGFQAGLRASTGHPVFEDSLVVSLLLYAGGASTRVLKEVFGGIGEQVESSVDDAKAQAAVALGRPIS